jgi:HlyD family secretion protein
MKFLSGLLKHKFLFLVGLVLFGLILTFIAHWWFGPQLAAEVVVRRDFVQTVVASGHVETPHRVDIGAQVTGTVASVPVKEGQAVKAGTVLIELDAAELQAVARQADVAVAQSQAKLR